MNKPSPAARGGSSASKALIPPQEQRFLEDALAALPVVATPGTTATAEELARYNHHANPYLRAYARVLWCGYALARGQVNDCYQKFKVAQRDASLAAIDKVTDQALAAAGDALDRSMGPDGSVSIYLVELRERTLQRLWARVCETSQMDPPSFGRIFSRAAGMEVEEDEEAEIDAWRREVAVVDDIAEAPEGDADEDDDEDDDAGGDDAGGEAKADDAGDDDDDDEDDDDEDAPAARRDAGGWQVRVTRQGSAEEIRAAIAQAAAELLHQMRKANPTGSLTLELRLGAASGGGGPRGGGGGDNNKRRRRRRKR